MAARLSKFDTYPTYIQALNLARGNLALEEAEMTLFCGIDRRLPRPLRQRRLSS